MEKSLPAPLRSLSPTQWAFAAAALILVSLLVTGTLLQPAEAQPNTLFGSQPFIVLAILAFGSGLLSFVSPCTLPVLTAYFAFAFQSDRSRIAANTVVFMLGLATTFSLLGAGASALGAVLYQNQPLIWLLGGSLIIVFGVMSLLGKGFTGVPAVAEGTRNTSVGGSYLFGLTFAAGWSSCVGPILGTVLTLAAQTNTVTRGMMLLFIYALGLGLPLMLVSTFFGRASRQGLFWRLLKGKGWEVTVPVLIVALVWALAIWRILLAVIEYAFDHFALFAGQSLLPVHEYGLLGLVIAGAVLWVATLSDERRVTIHLHTTQLVSGALFIMIGLLMLDGYLARFNSLIPTEFTEWLIIQEERLVDFFK